MSDTGSNTIPDLNCTGHRLRRATRRATQIYDQLLAPYGLTVTQYSLLAMLARDGELSLGALADRSGMDRTSITRTIRPLVREGHVAMTNDPDDGRVKLVSLTSNGLAASTQALGGWRKAQRHVGQALGAEQLDQLHGLLGTVSQLDDPKT